MSPENRPQSPNTKDLHPGIVPIDQGGERPHEEDVPSIQTIDTGEIPTLVPDHSGELTLKEQERGPFQEKLDAQRQYHQARSESTTEKSFWTKRTKVATAIGSVLLAAGIGTGVSVANMNNHSTSPEGSNTTQTDERFNLTPYSDLERNKLYLSLSGDQKDAINPLLWEDVAGFEKESVADRFKFGMLAYDTYREWGMYNAKDNKRGQTLTNPEAVPVISLQSSGQDIVNDVALKRAAQWYSLSHSGSPMVEVANRTTAIKMESIVSSPASSRYKGDTDHLATDSTFSNQFMTSTDMTVTKESPVITKADGTKEKVIQGTNLAGVGVQQRFIYQELPDYTGKARSNWVMVDTMTNTPDNDQSHWIPDVTSLK